MFMLSFPETWRSDGAQSHEGHKQHLQTFGFSGAASSYSIVTLSP